MELQRQIELAKDTASRYGVTAVVYRTKGMILFSLRGKRLANLSVGDVFQDVDGDDCEVLAVVS